MKLIVISFAASLLVGAWLGVGPAESEIPLTPEPTRRMLDDRTVERKWSREDFQSRARDIMGNALTEGNNPTSGLLESWIDAEIRAALDQALQDPDYVLENGGRGHVMDALFGEWMKRYLDAAIIWFDSVKIATARNRMIPNLSYRWPAEHAGRGLEFVISHKELFTRSSPWSILLKNMEASAKDGPDALGKMLGRIADEELALDFGSTAKLPEDFDYAGFVKTEGYLREKVHEQGARVILSGGIEPALKHLEGIRDPTRRLEILTAMDAVPTPGAFFMRQPVSTEDAESLRQKLREWQAGESQIEEILKMIKP